MHRVFSIARVEDKKAKVAREVTWIYNIAVTRSDAIHVDVLGFSPLSAELVTKVETVVIICTLISQNQKVGMGHQRQRIHRIGPYHRLNDLWQRQQEALMKDCLRETVRVRNRLTRAYNFRFFLDSCLLLGKLDPCVVVLFELLEQVKPGYDYFLAIEAETERIRSQRYVLDPALMCACKAAQKTFI